LAAFRAFFTFHKPIVITRKAKCKLRQFCHKRSGLEIAFSAKKLGFQSPAGGIRLEEPTFHAALE
jgi:hypothetical protein